MCIRDRYSNFEGGTRVPLLVRWPGRVRPATSEALISQVDFVASFAALAGQSLGQDDAPDSTNVLPALRGQSKTCLLYTSDAADDLLCVDPGGRRIIKKTTPQLHRNSTPTNAQARNYDARNHHKPEYVISQYYDSVEPTVHYALSHTK